MSPVLHYVIIVSPPIRRIVLQYISILIPHPRLSKNKNKCQIKKQKQMSPFEIGKRKYQKGIFLRTFVNLNWTLSEI